MYIPSTQAATSLLRRSIPQIPLSDAKFTLDASGVAGIFGGDEAVSAMATVHVYQGRKWLGWYNSPGAYEISKRYGQLAKSRLWSGLFPGPGTDPATLFELDGQKGPRFKSFVSGTMLPDSGHLGALLMAECEEIKGIPIAGRVSKPAVKEVKEEGSSDKDLASVQTLGKEVKDLEKSRLDPKTQLRLKKDAKRPTLVTVVNLDNVPPDTLFPTLPRRHSQLFASIPIFASVAACVLSGLFQDWWAFTMILLGIVTSGWACWVIGSGHFTFSHPIPAAGSPPGDGILESSSGVVVLIGEEGAVNAVTRGRFSLQFGSEPEYSNIGIASTMLMIQFIAQLLLIPQATLFGQLMFVMSLGVSWGYNSWLSSLDKEKIQRKILMRKVLKLPEENMSKFTVTTRTTMAVLVCLILSRIDPPKVLDDNVEELARDGPEKILHYLIPNDTKVWNRFRRTIALQIIENRSEFQLDCSDLVGLQDRDQKLLMTLCEDAEAARKAYHEHNMEAMTSRHR
ncbi:uncharacterized protein FIBRA_04551 [Fibroporia radiculosa]|uniref:Uncharacterized protein n=1 Tax=Fibroporia radiculosa TaxID=599839 RepID=J4HWL1_9APHY|nr:uncharacterized protein FIBRA_04551 [Fibroporia radiculosa]CCM02452.1 predicted protein [Fibroporia radiculosa]